MSPLHPMAYAREAERAAKLARLAAAEMDGPTARRYRALAAYYAGLATRH